MGRQRGRRPSDGRQRAAALYGERIRAPQAVGAALSLAGVLLVIARGEPAALARWYRGVAFALIAAGIVVSSRRRTT